MSKWWSTKPMRMVQTNLREIDVNLDVEELIKSLKDFSANVLLVNAGGIVANYPTSIECHYRNPNMRGDFFGRVISRAHEEGIKVIARFDFSKINEAYSVKHPEWLYKSPKGEFVNYNGQVHTCINGEYQQEYSIKILGEVIDNYPVDGIFFNMIGFVTSDYSGNYHGICQCNSCRKKFHERYGHDLPLKEDENDPVFRDYQKFKEEVCKELFDRITGFVKRKDENTAICNYIHEGVDIYRKESNTGLNRPLPEWNYSASENVRTVTGSWDGMQVSNSAVHFVDFPFRHSAVSPHLTSLRVSENIANGGWLDYYVIGTLTNQDDRLCMKDVRDLFKFHENNEEYFTDIRSIADVCLIVPDGSSMYGSMKEFRGLFRILAGSHILFDLIHDSVLEKPNAYEKLKRYKAVILPDVRSMGEEAVSILERYVSEGGSIISTGLTSTCDIKGNPMGQVRLKSSGITAINEVIEKVRGTYFRVRSNDKAYLNGFEDLDIVYLDDDFMNCEISENTKGYLGYMPPCMFGPPEKCYYTIETDKPGLIINSFGRGKSAYFPWNIGRHYEKLSNHAHMILFMSVLNNLLEGKALETEASPLVEFILHEQRDGKWMTLCCVNHSGQLGTAFLPPVPMRDIAVKLKAVKKPQKVCCLKNKAELTFNYGNDGYLNFTIPELNLLETVVIMQEG